MHPRRGRRFATYNPATGEPITRVARAYEEDVDRAVKVGTSVEFSEVDPHVTEP